MTSDATAKAKCTMSKFWLHFINSCYLVLGIIIIAVAAAANAEAVLTHFTILGGVICMGVFLMALSILGIVATERSSQVLLFLYIVFMVLLFIVQFSVGLAAIATPRSQQEELLLGGWCRLTPKAKGWFQHTRNCYAFHANDTPGSTRYTCEGPPYPSDEYETCPTTCRVTTTNCTATPAPPADAPVCPSCYESVKDLTEKLLNRGGGVCLAFAFVELVGIWAAYRHRQDTKAPATYSAFL
eukprot:TRINITY_DN8757_c0_g1_i1.p3 TRINITY_DN8757_c0_g1~~TRINITY_DN8757_c0_g1_i1.p3  ORF type:complete len:241 (+),score=21.17 TRINITY_DN8757_c0_g1_i1:2972-3694(+)